MMEKQARTLAEMAEAAERNEGKGPVCPYCGCRHFVVPSTWKVAAADVFAKRRRVCRNCGKYELTTKEVPAD